MCPALCETGLLCEKFLVHIGVELGTCTVHIASTLMYQLHSLAVGMLVRVDICGFTVLLPCCLNKHYVIQ